MTRRVLPFAILMAGCLLAPATVLAQGNSGNNGKPKAPKSDKPAPTPPATTPSTPSPAPAPGPAPAPTPTTPPAGSNDVGASSVSNSLFDAATVPDVYTSAASFRQFGSWLDDASAPTKGEGHTSVGMGHWRMQGMTQTNMPMIGMGVGVSDRLQVSASLPFYRASYDGAVASGIDDVYLAAKYTLVDPTLTLSEVGLAISPVVEILSRGGSDRRVHFAVPVNVEIRRLPFRVYGSAGYFTRGSVFTGGALEWTSQRRATLTASFTQSYSIRRDVVLDQLGVGARRADVSGSVAYPLATALSGYVSVGRSLTSLEEGGTAFSLSGGLAMRFNAASARRP